MENKRESGEPDAQTHNGKQEVLTQNLASYLNTPTSSTTVQRSSGGNKTDNGSNNKSDVISAMATTKQTHQHHQGQGSATTDASGSLVDKLRDHYQKSPKGLKASKFSFIFFHFHATSMLVMMLTTFIPYLMQDYSDMAQYYTKIFFCYLYAMTEANWWCSLLYKSDLPDVRDKPTTDQDDWFQKPPETLQNTIEDIEPKIDRCGFEWKYCQFCKRYKPPRSHHCDMCKKCVLRRDHHCYFIGRCVGHYNQRYFVVLTYYGVLCSIVCAPLTLSYLLSLSDATWWGDYFLPVTLVNFFYYNTLSWQFTLSTYQCYGWAVLFLWSGFYLTIQLSLIGEGKTLVELAKQFDMKVTSTWKDHMRMVFGDYWCLNLLFPAQIIFKQRHDGVHYENVKFLGKNQGAAR